MSLHANSLTAFYAEQAEGAFSQRETMILECLLKHGPQTDREIMQRLGFVEPGSVRPRLTALIDYGAVLETGDKECPVTGKTVRIVRIAADPRKPQREFQFT